MSAEPFWATLFEHATAVRRAHLVLEHSVHGRSRLACYPERWLVGFSRVVLFGSPRCGECMDAWAALRLAQAKPFESPTVAERDPFEGDLL